MIDSVYKVHSVNVSSLNADELLELYTGYSSSVEKYNLQKQFRDIDEYKNLYLSAFSDGNELFIINEDSLLCGILSFVKSADWAGVERYNLTIYLSISIISENLKKCLNKFITEKLKQHSQIAIITYNDELKQLIDAHSSKVQLRANVYTLDKNDVDIDLLNSSIEKYQAQNSNLRMTYTDIISEG